MPERLSGKILLVLMALFSAVTLPAGGGNPDAPPPPAAEDASDRAYLDRIENLLNSAQESIDVAMFAVNIRPVPEDPGFRLVEALKRAAEKGKRVRLWLNSRQASVGSSRIFMRQDLQEELEKKGIRLFYVQPEFRLHDKLIVVDSHIVVDGSMNWTREALLKNFESVSVIHSEELARQKTIRLEGFPVLKKKDQLGGAPLEKKFPFPTDLLRDPLIFPASLEGQEARTLALYLLFTERASRTGESIFEISLEEWGEKLPFRKRWIGPSLRHEMRRTLDFLKKRYRLIEWESLGTREARIHLKPVSSSEQVFVPFDWIEAGHLKGLSPRALFVYLVARHKAQLSGNVPFWLGPISGVSSEFHLNPVTLIRGLWELKRANLIEIFPSEKRLVGGRWEREFTNRYLFNPVLSAEARQKRLRGLREKYGAERIEQAGRLAGSIDEPEDFGVITEFAEFLERYPVSQVEEAARTVSRFNRNNALRTPAYVRGILERSEAEAFNSNNP